MQLVVKSSNFTCGDLVLQCGSDWRIIDVKLQLRNIHPAKPEPWEQKLISAGRLLDDDLLIEDIIKSSTVQGTPILHLVCHVLNFTTEDSATSQNMSHMMLSSPNGIRQQDGSTSSMEDSQSSQFPLWSNVPESQLLAQHMAWWQQAYTQHYRSQYAQYLSSMGYYWPNPVLQSAVSPAQPVAPEAPAMAPAEEPQAAPDQPPVGQVNEANDDLNPARDWLDWMYIGTRLAVLLAVVFYYSSLSRVLMVVFIALAVYIYQNDYVRPLQREVNNNINEAAPVEEEVDTNRQEVRNPEDAVLRPVNPSTFSIAINMLTGFFASLIPEVPAPEAL